MADCISQGVFRPPLPKHLIFDEDRQIIEAFGISIEPDCDGKLVLFADNWCNRGAIVAEDSKDDIKLTEDDLYARCQEIIRRSNGELSWISRETAYTCTENRSDGFGGSAVFITSETVQFIATDAWLEQRKHETEIGDESQGTEVSSPSKPAVLDQVNARRGGYMNSSNQMAKEPTNEERAGRIDTVMRAYCITLEGRDFGGDEDDVKDLLADLMHFCERMEIDFEGNLRVARDNFEYERETETGISNLL